MDPETLVDPETLEAFLTSASPAEKDEVIRAFAEWWLERAQLDASWLTALNRRLAPAPVSA